MPESTTSVASVACEQGAHGACTGVRDGRCCCACHEPGGSQYRTTYRESFCNCRKGGGGLHDPSAGCFAWDLAVDAERARLRAGVKARWFDEWRLTPGQMIRVLALIDGGETRGGDDA